MTAGPLRKDIGSSEVVTLCASTLPHMLLLQCLTSCQGQGPRGEAAEAVRSSSPCELKCHHPAIHGHRACDTDVQSRPLFKQRAGPGRSSPCARRHQHHTYECLVTHLHPWTKVELQGPTQTTSPLGCHFTALWASQAQQQAKGARMMVCTPPSLILRFWGW
eukprot:1063066-Pelagomonas_calceolata.AAC.6